MDKLAMIRKRKSYEDFKRVLEKLKKGNKAKLLKLVYEIIDRRRGYGSITNSEYAHESLNLIIKDYEL